MADGERALTPWDRALAAYDRSSGSGGLFRLAYRELSPMVNATARQLLLGDGEEAKDVTHEVFIRLHAKLAELEPAGLPGWLQRATCMVVCNVRRKRKRYDKRLERYATARGRADSISPSKVMSALMCREVLACLPDEQRLVVIQKLGLGLTYEEIANAMQCTVPVVRRLLRSAQTELERLANHDPTAHSLAERLQR